MKNALHVRIKSICIVAMIALTSLPSYGQKIKEFTGMLEYKISITDTVSNSTQQINPMIIYTNDTICRMENFTGQLGKQVTIRHMEKNKSYLLIEVSDSAKFAIKTNLDVSDSLRKATNYTFKKKMFKTKIMGMRANRMIVDHPDFAEPIEFLYLKKYSREYLNNFPSIPGLLVKYSVDTPNGIMDYELTKFSEYDVNRDLFGIPSDYQKVTLDEFMDQMLDLRNLTPE